MKSSKSESSVFGHHLVMINYIHLKVLISTKKTNKEKRMFQNLLRVYSIYSNVALGVNPYE